MEARPIDLVQKYMDCFFGHSPLHKMRSLLAEDLIFEGPLHRSCSARSYLEALDSDPPSDVHYEIEEVYESENSVCLIYQFSKPGVATRMAQTFEIRDGKICRIRLVFDTRGLS